MSWYWLLKAVHVLCAVVWVGGMFFAYVVLRPSLSVLEPPQRMALHVQVFRRFFKIVWHVMPLIILTGLAGLAAGASSMAAGEYVSVSSQNELIYAEVNKERLELENNAAAEISENPEKALAVHTLEELGVDSTELPSPYVAAGASLASFAIGALIPLLPYLLGLQVLWAALGLAAVAAIAGGGMVSRLTERPFWRGALRQLVLGAAAAGITYLIGIGVHHVA